MTEQFLFFEMLMFGACVGSFLGVLIYRLPLGLGPWSGRSSCENCGVHLPAGDLIPIISFLWVKGRCRNCNTPVRREVLGIEIAAMAIGGLSTLIFQTFSLTLCAAVLAWALLALAWIDAKHFYLPDIITIPLIFSGLVVTFFTQPSDFSAHLWGAVAGYVVFLAINITYKYFRNREGLGHGDAKLMALAGAWTGWLALPWIVFAAGVMGLLYALIRVSINDAELSATTRLPLGTFLAPAIFAAYVYMMLQA